jgi:hypothetical protein
LGTCGRGAAIRLSLCTCTLHDHLRCSHAEAGSPG